MNKGMNKRAEKPGPGRRAGQPETRQAILDAARARFTAEGFTATTVRAIATDAGVDAAMINYFFGSKQKLFEEALALRANPMTLIPPQLKGSVEGLPRRILTTLLETWDNPEFRSPLLALVSNLSDDPTENALIRSFLEDSIAGPIATRLTEAGLGADMAAARAGMMASQLVGVVIARYVVVARPFADLQRQVIIDTMAPALEMILLGGTHTR
ncbi:TetR/AcrR family transcriptional regulator [Antrihabitans stalactiti]|nr:TetR/AcrR family transcriptional regulator [Antrihabitans stalactiti]